MLLLLLLLFFRRSRLRRQASVVSQTISNDLAWGRENKKNQPLKKKEMKKPSVAVT